MADSVGDLAKRFKKFREEFAKGLVTAAAAKDAMTLSVPRIFEQGKTTSGATFKYSTKPGYFTDGPKASNKTGKTGKAIKTGYYAGGYAEFRSQQGRESSHVNFRLTNELQSDYANSKVSVSSTGLANPIPIKIDNFTYVITLNKNINIQKRSGLENKYGIIFSLNQKEEAQFALSSDFLTGQLLNKFGIA